MHYLAQQTKGRLKITAKQQPTNHYNFHVLMTNHITTKLTNPNHNHKIMLSSDDNSSLDSEDDYCSEVVKMSVTTNNLSKDYPHPDDHAKQIWVSVLPFQKLHFLLN